MKETGNGCRGRIKRLLSVCAVIGMLFAAFALGKIAASVDEPYKEEHAKARNALRITNIQRDFVPNFVFHGSHIGRDRYSQTFFEVTDSERRELMELIRSTEGWHAESLSSEDYCDFVDITWYPFSGQTNDFGGCCF